MVVVGGVGGGGGGGGRRPISKFLIHLSYCFGKKKKTPSYDLRNTVSMK